MTTHYQKIQALGNKMVSNLESMGVSANFNDGGMTLADKILEIQHFDNGLKLYADKNIGKIGDEINLYALVLKDNIAQSGKTILFKGLVNSTGTTTDYSVYGVTGNNGIANVTYTCSGVGDKNIQAIYQSSDSILVSSSSNIIDVTVIDPTLFSDNCTEDNTSQYNTIQIVKNATTTLTFDTDHYQITGSGKYAAGYSIPNTDNMDNVEADITIKNMVDSVYNQLLFGLKDTDTGEDYMFCLCSDDGDGLFLTELINEEYTHENGEDIVTNISDITTSKHTIKLVKKGTSFTGTLLNSNGEVLGSKELTLPSISNYKYVFGVWCERGTSTSSVSIYDIKASKL